MSLSAFLSRVKTGDTIDFQQTMAIIADHYHYQPTKFSNGLQLPLVNDAGHNEGSCKIFAFAKLHDLDQPQTLALFGAYYYEDVLNHPAGSDHQNIRTFMRDGWDGVQFKGEALTPK
ncbi:MAG: HopJ type III effector protein [Methylomonas sp.]|nr:HopJ type III effector protein [Methylomonas sp.]PPD22784.1 MAG: type III effector [Methylomonas sp.]PPD26769.1 MAG: type III effector [Methylomonas sp.]PPD38604.1 MAG: type III effector [Methylomonas sp.]PPD42777.1 MAG: type III effector [Methylomonas sp.]